MTKPNFQEMTLKELKAYVLANRYDDEAFYTYMDKRRAGNPNPVMITIEEADAKLKRRFGQRAI
ncbi:hypothetical protein F7734_20150 [Scytonema sp. UIC 10036]|uniref:DUF6887 family protein n=1 Tax=Scytonema sp. UIC 10036 TaxID=2304196 RepID=UPI0012DA4838|nr:hypothetical protein [Scytonema sp. UIC 10036]MUG94562.1 hypothetical protein [Scytonema sp. UIC 10036]